MFKLHASTETKMSSHFSSFSNRLFNENDVGRIKHFDGP
jgi:hypothetical protein